MGKLAIPLRSLGVSLLSSWNVCFLALRILKYYLATRCIGVPVQNCSREIGNCPHEYCYVVNRQLCCQISTIATQNSAESLIRTLFYFLLKPKKCLFKPLLTCSKFCCRQRIEIPGIHRKVTELQVKVQRTEITRVITQLSPISPNSLVDLHRFLLTKQRSTTTTAAAPCTRSVRSGGRRAALR